MADGVGSVFRGLRLEQQRTLEEVAEGARVHRNTLISIEQGRAQPTIPPAARIANQLRHRLSLLPEATPAIEGEYVLTNGDGDEPETAVA